ncbi:MAG TPA: UbiH/UbiF family hydroxylase [Casimicrobiaceae bacterium]|nr:UbiH/UbiF family hydroxylase [Casimicrobiaceae bacterium]
MKAAGIDYDVAILGAGLVGMALAAALARQGLRVALLERSALAAFDGPAGAEDWDQRVYAVSPGSAEFLRGLGAWQRLAADRIAAIEVMDVHGDSEGAIAFSAYELGERALAWIVENRALAAALVEVVRTAERVDVLAPCEPNAVAWSADVAQVTLADGRSLSARLVVGADGVRSWVRREAGIAREPQAYGQTAIVANFAAERAHRGRAFQWFIEREGVLAWLPLPGRRISIVWSAPDVLAAELLALDAAPFAARVGAAGGLALGALTLVTPPAAFPLSFLKLRSVVEHRLALVGDAAHGVHPLAGQGVNLGFGDAAPLAGVLAARGPVADAGARILLERYARKRALPVLSMQIVTDGLVRLFGAPGLRLLRNRGMTVVGKLATVRRLLAQPALR